MTQTASQLLEKIRNGQPEAMAQYLEHRKIELIGVIISKMGPALRSKVEPDDIYQEVCSDAVQNMDQVNFDDHDPFGWFCELAKRRIIDSRRRFSAQKRAANREVSIQPKSDDGSGGLVNLLVASITSPSQAFSRNQREFKLLQAMEQLTEQQRQVLHMRYGKSWPSKKIADEIGKSDGATRVLITRSLKKLEKLLGEIG